MTLNRARMFAGVRLGISISPSPNLGNLGLGEAHLQDAFVELSRYWLAAGGDPAYGGDLRSGGYTELLLDLFRTYRQEVSEVAGRIHSYLAWPLSLQLDPSYRAKYKGMAVFHEVAPPSDVTVDTKEYLAPDSTQSRIVWARCLTEMRETMNRETDGRVLLGGKSRGFLGRYPGLLEEALLALRASKPLFLAGGFGGCAGAIVDAVMGLDPPEFRPEFQEADAAYAELLREFNRAVGAGELETEPIDWAKAVGDLGESGIAGLKNGLSIEENETLFRSIHTHEIVALVLRGLSRLRAGGAS